MRGHNDTNWADGHQPWIVIWKERYKYVLIDQPIREHLVHMSNYMDWYWENSKVCLTRFVTQPNIAPTSCSTPKIEIEQHPSPQSPPVVVIMYDEGLQPPPQSYEFTPQQNHHQDYRYNSQFFSASGEDFMNNLIGTDFRTPKSIYAYMQSMFIPSFPSFH